MKNQRIPIIALLSSLTASFMLPLLEAQITEPSTRAANDENQDTPVVLSPFVVDASEDAGSYQATSTLAGARVKTDLRDIASSITVVTADFLKDTGARNNQDLLVYTTNTEVGGVSGNYAGIGSPYTEGANESGNFLRPNSNNRVRGLDTADNTRDLFPTDIPWDSYTVGRVDLQRGPNSILFGFGSPAGIINASLNTAAVGKNSGSFENRIGTNGSLRNSFDYNLVVLPNQLGIRFAALDDHTKYQQEPAFNRDRRLFGALRYSPDFLKLGSAKTTIRINYEHGDVKANRPRILPPWDRISPFFDPNAINRQTWDPFYAWEAGIVPYSSTATIPGQKGNVWIGQAMGPGLQSSSNPMFFYDNQGATNQKLSTQAGPGTYFGLNAAGERDAGIEGFPFGSNIGIASFSEAASNTTRSNGTGSENFPAANRGIYKQKSITDPSIFDFYNHLIDGPNKREWQKWDAYNITLEQLFFNNRAGFEVAYDRQKYSDGQTRNLGGDAYISVDIRSNLMRYPWAFTDMVVPNPDAGRAFVGSSSRGGNNMNISDRENVRVTAFGDVRASDYISNSRIARILGRSVFTGVYSNEIYKNESRSWVRYALDETWSNAIGTGGNGTTTGSNQGGLTNGDRVIDWVTYLSGDLRNQTSPANLNLQPITAVQSPRGTYGVTYFNSQWNAPNVDPSTPWFNPARGLANTPPGLENTESENPANYVGWVTQPFNVLNADEGDINRLYTETSRIRRATDSKAFTWQAYLWDDTIVGTWGWRKDKQKVRAGGSTAVGVTGAAQPNPVLNPQDPEGITEGTSRSWGVVVHTPRGLRERLPWGSDLSLTYSDGRNSRVENRYGFSGRALPNAQGRTKDIGVVLSTMNDRLQFKITHYKTTVENANISSVSSESTTLGNNTYYLRNLEAWGTATVMAYLRGRAGELPGETWFWNFASQDEGGATGPIQLPTSPEFQSHPSTIQQTAAINSWLAQMQPPEWFAAYGFDINYAAAKAGDWRNAFPGWTPSASIGGIQPASGGRIRGTWPTGTVNNESKGFEYEIVGRPTKNLNISLNASKVHASQTSLGTELVQFIESQHAKYESPAGDIRLWWAGGDPLRKVYNENIWSAYQFQLQTTGRLVPEMAPWRFNGIVNYEFDQGRLDGLNVGIGYRWQDRRILGYGLNAAKESLDINAPFWSSTEDHFDLWAGYERKLTDKIGWRIQINLRNVGEDAHLVPFSVEPDGSPAAYRIQEGMAWSLTNTFTF